MYVKYVLCVNKRNNGGLYMEIPATSGACVCLYHLSLSRLCNTFEVVPPLLLEDWIEPQYKFTGTT